MDVLLIAGLWLRRGVWDEVAAGLVARGHRPVSVALPGVDDGVPTATLDDQLAAVLAALPDEGSALVVGHSAASTLAWLAADARPDRVARVAMIGGFPTSDGGIYFTGLPVTGDVVPFPGWEPFAGPDSDDLDAAARERFAADAVPVPATVASAAVHYTDQRRFAVPVTVVCPEFGPDDARDAVDGGEVPELSRATTVEYVDVDSGHWPMITRPDELAALLAEAAR